MVKLFAVLILMTSAAVQSTAQVKNQNDVQTLNQARALYASGKLDEAVKLYDTITASSDFWLDSLEERAWAYTREKKYEKALGDLKSITNKVWAPQVGPETMMLSAFVSLKICAYKDVIDKVERFRKRMIPRVEALENILARPTPAALMTHLKKASSGKLKMADLGADAEKFPRYFFRDQVMLSSYENNDLENLTRRLRTLAERDLEEIAKNIKKMKVLEVEVIQRVFTSEKISQKKEPLKFEKYDKNTQVSFLADDEEVWIDEVGNYEVKAQKCAM